MAADRHSVAGRRRPDRPRTPGGADTDEGSASGAAPPWEPTASTEEMRSPMARGAGRWRLARPRPGRRGIVPAWPVRSSAHERPLPGSARSSESGSRSRSPTGSAPAFRSRRSSEAASGPRASAPAIRSLRSPVLPSRRARGWAWPRRAWGRVAVRWPPAGRVPLRRSWPSWRRDTAVAATSSGVGAGIAAPFRARAAGVGA